MTSLPNKLTDDLMSRHAWLIEDAEQIRRWREEDARNGIEWGTDSISRERGGEHKAVPNDNG